MWRQLGDLPGAGALGGGGAGEHCDVWGQLLGGLGCACGGAGGARPPLFAEAAAELASAAAAESGALAEEAGSRVLSWMLL